MAGKGDRREYALVVFGVTGVTGWEVARFLAKRLATDKTLAGRRLAVAGRREAAVSAKARAIEAEFPAARPVGVIVADATRPESLEAMAKRTEVVLACAGPFRFLGEPVVAACAKNGTSYADVTGEPEFSERIALHYDDQAKRNGATLVTCAGFDSIPADIGLLHAKRAFLERYGPSSLPLHVVSSLSLHAGPAGFAGNTATYESAIHGFGSVRALKAIRKEAQAALPSWLLPGKLALGPRLKTSRGVGREPRELGGKLTLPFPGSDASVVRRSQMWRWREACAGAGLPVAGGAGSAAPASDVSGAAFVSLPRDAVPVQHACYVSFGSWWYLALTMLAGALLSFLAGHAWGRALLSAFPEQFTFGAFKKGGPTAEQRAGTSFDISFVTRGYKSKASAEAALRAAAAGTRSSEAPDASIVTRVGGPEPGYVATPIFVGETALCLLRARASSGEGRVAALPTGVLTPGAALANSDLIARLMAQGIKFDVCA